MFLTCFLRVFCVFFQTVAIIAEGVPESQTRKLNKLAQEKGVGIIGPATVGGTCTPAWKCASPPASRPSSPRADKHPLNMRERRSGRDSRVLQPSRGRTPHSLASVIPTPLFPLPPVFRHQARVFPHRQHGRHAGQYHHVQAVPRRLRRVRLQGASLDRPTLHLQICNHPAS